MGYEERRNPFGVLRGCGGYRRPYFADPIYGVDRSSRHLLSELKVMYAKGKIDTNLYYAIKAEINTGDFTWERLRSLKHEKTI